MRIPLRALVAWLTMGALFVTSPVRAQQHVVDSTLLQQAIAEQRAVDDVHRQSIERALMQPEVQAVAARLGLDIKDARTAVASITGDELAAVAATAQAVNAELAGGQGPTITISLVVLLLVIIIVILIAD